MNTDKAGRHNPVEQQNRVTEGLDLSKPSGRRMRIRELCNIHQTITTGEIVTDIVRSVEVTEAEVIGTLVELDCAGYIMILDAEDPMEREVVLA